MPTPHPIDNAANVANSFASLSVALTWGSIILAVIVLMVGIAWGKIVVAAAEKEAKKDARECADSYISTWLANEAPAIVRQHVENLRNVTLGSGNDDSAADTMGEEA